MTMNAFRAAKIAVARQISSMKDPTFEEVEKFCRERLALPEMQLRVAVTGKRKLLNPSHVERELDGILVEVGEIIDMQQYLHRCKRWATYNAGASFASFCRVMSFDRGGQARLKKLCNEFGVEDGWVDKLEAGVHDDSAFGFMDNDDLELTGNDGDDPSGMVTRSPSLEQLDGDYQ